MADFLDRMLSVLATELPELTPDRALSVELKLRQVEGGTEAGYIAKKPSLQRISRMGQALAHGAALRDVMGAEGCHRATAYRILSRPLKR